jgi:hypothetical protein
VTFPNGNLLLLAASKASAKSAKVMMEEEMLVVLLVEAILVLWVRSALLALRVGNVPAMYPGNVLHVLLLMCLMLWQPPLALL